MPQVVVIDEIGTELEAMAAGTIMSVVCNSLVPRRNTLET